jgi:hypothetical protein
LTSDALADPCLSAHFPCYRSPPCLSDGSSFLEVRPLQSLSLPPSPADVSAGLRLPLGFRSLQRCPSDEPHMKRLSPRFGATLGFSQPLSGFLANPSFAALSRAATVPGILPSERSPRRDRLPLSGQLGFPAVIHRRAETRTSTPYRPWFHRRPRKRVRLDPPTTMNSLSSSRSPPPGRPGSRATGPSRPASFTYFEASLSPSPFAAASGFPSSTGRCSLGFRPL